MLTRRLCPRGGGSLCAARRASGDDGERRGARERRGCPRILVRRRSRGAPPSRPRRHARPTSPRLLPVPPIGESRVGGSPDAEARPLTPARSFPPHSQGNYKRKWFPAGTRIAPRSAADEAVSARFAPTLAAAESGALDAWSDASRIRRRARPRPRPVLPPSIATPPIAMRASPPPTRAPSSSPSAASPADGTESSPRPIGVPPHPYGHLRVPSIDSGRPCAR